MISRKGAVRSSFTRHTGLSYPSLYVKRCMHLFIHTNDCRNLHNTNAINTNEEHMKEQQKYSSIEDKQKLNAG